jgi:hypothetical protein
VQNIDRPFRQSNELGFGICDSPFAGINVSPDRSNWGDAAQRVYDFGTSDVAAVDDVIDASQAMLRFRPQQPVRVGDYPDPEGHQWQGPLVCIGQSSVPVIVTTTARSIRSQADHCCQLSGRSAPFDRSQPHRLAARRMPRATVERTERFQEPPQAVCKRARTGYPRSRHGLRATSPGGCGAGSAPRQVDGRR